MNKIIISASLFSMLTIGACSQTSQEKTNASTEIPSDLWEGGILEDDSHLDLTQEQKMKIKNINQNIGARFREIGQDTSLSGYEKGQKKRELAIQHKKEIYEILTPSQISDWEKKHGGNRNSIKDNYTDRIDDQIDALEDSYDDQKKAIEENESLSKEEKKALKKELESKFKAEKEKLKLKKDQAENSDLLQGQ